MNRQQTGELPGVSESNPSAPHTRIKSVSASQQIHESLKERIIRLELAPGQNLSRAEVSETYGVSQTPVRDAMQRLEEEGLLRIFPQSKTEVSRIDIAHAQETQFLRLSVELEVVRRLCAAEGRSFSAEIASVVTRQERALDAADMDQFSRLDRVFHRTLCRLVGVENLWTLITARSGHIDRLRQLNLPDPGKQSSIMDCHNRILSAIRAGDAEEAVSVVREHLSGTLAQADEIRARYPDYF